MCVVSYRDRLEADRPLREVEHVVERVRALVGVRLSRTGTDRPQAKSILNEVQRARDFMLLM
jgi:hypothetical protein